jgi:hypothetical protein
MQHNELRFVCIYLLLQVEVRALHHALAAVAAERDALRKLIHPHRQCKRRVSTNTTTTAAATAAVTRATADATAGTAAASTTAGAGANKADSSVQLQSHYLTLASSQAAADKVAAHQHEGERGELVERLRHMHCKLMQQAHDRYLYSTLIIAIACMLPHQAPVRR